MKTTVEEITNTVLDYEVIDDNRLLNDYENCVS